MLICRASLVAVLVLLAGCRTEVPFPDLQPLEGTVTLDGTPVKGGGLIFLRETGDPTGLTVNASVNADGTFAGTSSRTSARGAEIRPGVPVGRYKAVYHPLSDGSRDGLETAVAEVFEFRPGPNRLDIQLKGKAPTGAGAPRDDANPPDHPLTPKR